MDQSIYADYNATTPLAPEVTSAITKSLHQHWGNPSSSHFLGQLAREAVEKAREEVARLVGGKPAEVTFVSGGTEANNWVIRGACRNKNGRLPHVVTTTVEHDSVDLVLEHLETKGEAAVTRVQLHDGQLHVEDVVEALTDDTVLVTVMAANNETGVILPIKGIGLALRAVNEKRTARGLNRILFHSDCAQIIGKEPVSGPDWGVDCITIVGHKFYGPRIGALWSREPLPPLLQGGGQEYGRRPGTENTPMIVGLGTAADLVSRNIETYSENMARAQLLFQKIVSGDQAPSKCVINCLGQPRLPNTINISFQHSFTGQDVLAACKRVVSGVGAACHSGGCSKNLLNSGVSLELAATAIRISFGRETTDAEVRAVADDLFEAIRFLQSRPT